METNKYYKPEKEEFHVGFKYEIELREGKWGEYSFPEIPRAGIDWGTTRLHDIPFRFGDHLRVKYLDREDIESLGFKTNTISSMVFDKSYNDNNIISIRPYWNMQRMERENLVRIYIGVENNFPYSEVFCGNIKNKSELQRLLAQVSNFVYDII